MKILHTVEFYAPSRGGSQEVVRQISERLAAQGHTVTVATSRLAERTTNWLNGVRIEEFDIGGNAVRGIYGEADRYRQFLLGGDFDLMLNYAAQQWTADLAFPLLGNLPYRKVFIPCGFSALHNRDYSAYFRSMPNVLRSYDHLVFHAGAYQDIEMARKSGVEHLSIIPNGAAAEEFDVVPRPFREKYEIPANMPLLLTVGSHTGEKGHQTTLGAFHRARIGQAWLVIIGNSPLVSSCLQRCTWQAAAVRRLSGGKRRVLLLDPRRDEVIDAYHAADLFVFPSNFEYSPLVLFEAAAAGLPFISAACGNAEEIAAWTGGGEIVPARLRASGRMETRARTLAQYIERLWADVERRKMYAEKGRSAWREGYTWEKIAARYAELYAGLVEAR